MLATVVAVIALSLPSNKPQVLATSTSIHEAAQEQGTQQVVLVPANPATNPATIYVPVTSIAIPEQSSSVGGELESQPVTDYAVVTPSVPVEQSINYLGIAAIITALFVVLQHLNYIFGMLYRVGISTPNITIRNIE